MTRHLLLFIAALAVPAQPLFAQTTLTLQPDAATGKDALLHGLASEVNVNYGNLPQWSADAWTFNGPSGVTRAVMDFDLSSIPVGATVSSATLYLYAWNSNTGLGAHSDLSGSNAGWLQRVTESWNESVVTWNTQPTSTTINEVSVPGTSNPAQDYALNVSALVQDMVNDPANSHGFLLRLQNEDYYRRLNFCSSDHTDAARRPTLSVTYIETTVTDTCITRGFAKDDVKDALLHGLGSEQDVNYGSLPQWSADAWTFSGTPGVTRAVMELDLSSIPADAVVSSATLYLYAWNANTGLGSHSELSGSNACWLERVTENWNEGNVTWNTQPASTPANAVFVPGTSDPAQDYALNVTGLVQDMVSDPANSHGFLLRLQNEDYYRRLCFCSSDHPDPSRRPGIEVCYSTNIGMAERPEPARPLLLFPSPAAHEVYLQFETRLGSKTEITITDATGKVVTSLASADARLTLDVTSYAEGCYAVRTWDGAVQRTGRFVVAR